MTDNSGIEGLYFKATKHGYKNMGIKAVDVGKNPKFLQIASRCNQLLKSQKDYEEEEDEMMKEIQCTQVVEKQNKKQNLLAKQLLTTNPNAKFLSLRKSNIEPITEVDDEMKNSRLTIKKDELTSRKFSLDTERKNGLEQKYQKLLKQLEEEKQGKLNLQKQYNKLLEEALKNKFIEKKQDEEEYSQKKPKKPYFQNKSKRVKTTVLQEDQEEDQESEEDNQCFTERLKYKHDEGKQTTRNYEESYDDTLEQRIFSELNALNMKIVGLEESIKTKEERIMRNLLERDLKTKEKQVQFLRTENSNLKLNNRPTIEPKATIFNYMVIFLLAFLFARAISC